MARRKKDSVHAPATRAEAELMMAEYTELERARMLEELAADEAVDRIKTQLCRRKAELDAETQPLFAGLKGWWEEGGKAEVAGQKRSATIGTAIIGIRLTPPAVKLARGVKLDEAVSWLMTSGWVEAKRFIRTKLALDKETIIKAIRAEPEIAKLFKDKLTVEQKDEFFIDTGLDAGSLRKETDQT